MGNCIGSYRSCLILILLILALIPSVAAADTMFRASPERTGVFDNSGIAPNNTELWRFETRSNVRSSPALSNGIIYVGSDAVSGGTGTLHAIDAVTGMEKWRFKTKSNMRSAPAASYAFSSPALSNGFVYVGSDDGNLYAIDAMTGTERWRFETGDIVLSSPAVSDGFVYVGSRVNKVYSIDAVTGMEKWRFATGSNVLSSLAVSNGVVYVGSDDGNLYAIDAVTGKEKWRFATGGSVYSSPAVSNGVVYVGSRDNNLYAIEVVTGKEKWRFKTGSNVESSPAVSNGVVYIGSWDKNVYAIDVVTGKEKWRFKTGDIILSSPAVSNGVVYVGSRDNKVYSIDVVTGKEKWRFETGSYVDSSPIVSNGVVYFGSADGNLYAIGGALTSQETTQTPNSGIVPTITELWRFPTNNSVYSSPVVSNGIVYVGSQDRNLYAIDAVTGKEKWLFETGGAVYSSPAVSNGIVYVGSWDNNLYAIDAITGKEVWRYTTWRKVYSSPLVSNGVVYIGSDDGNLYAFDAVTGNVQWQFQTGGYVKFSPAVANGVVYVGSDDGNLYGIDAVTGKEKWRFATGGSVYSSPTVSNGVVYFGGGPLYAVYAMTGTEKWRSGVGGGSSPAVSNGTVYGYDVNLYAINAVTGMENWRFAIGRHVEKSPPSLADGVVYVWGSDNSLYAINAGTGKEQWRYIAKGDVRSSPAVSNGVVYFGSSDGNLYAIGKAPTIQVTTQTTATTQPVASPVTAVITAVPTPVIQAASLSFSPSDYGFSTASLLLIGLVVIVLLAGGGYTIHRMRKKPSPYASPVNMDKKIISPSPPLTGPIIKPDLALTLDRSQLDVDDWDRMTIQLANRGNAPAKNVQLIFSDEFETKWIKPVTIPAGATTSLDIGIRPKLKGKIPLEVTALYRDDHDKEYRETHEFWIDVVEKGTATSPPSETPSSPVSLFTPKPLTPKQLPPDLSDRYTESEFIGKGGFARVFKAKRKDGKYVAVKIPISMDAMTGRSFITEMQNWTKLSHPNIVRLYDFNIMPLPYFEEELCDSALADQNKPIECEKAAWILFNICEGLKFAHTQKIIHRDLKPQNILLKNGVPKISDWGLSRIISESTTTTATSFTPHYAAPEQINNRVKDERTDIWQLGVILYELVTGMLPFNGDSMVEIGMNIATKDPKRPGEIQPDAQAMDAVVMKCLQKDPAKRYQSVLELQKDLAMYLRRNYTELLKISVTAHDNNQSAFYCGDLVMVNLLTGDMKSAYKYLLDLVQYSRGDVKVQAQELSEQLKMRMEMGVTEIPDELIQKAEFIVHQVSVGFRKRG